MTIHFKFQECRLGLLVKEVKKVGAHCSKMQEGMGVKAVFIDLNQNESELIKILKEKNPATDET